MSAFIRKAALPWAGAAALAMAACLSFAFTRQGTIGLFQWQADWRGILIGLGVLGLLPLALALAVIRVIRDRARKAGTVLAWIASALGTLALAAALGVLGYITGTSRSFEGPVPPIVLVDPRAGIEPSKGSVRLSLGSDAHWDAETANAPARSAILKSVSASVPRRDALFLLGDTVERGMDGAPWHDAIAEMSAVLGDMPIRPIMGNHDAVIDGEYHYKRYFMPEGMETDSGSPYYYSMSAGPATIIVLNLLWGAESFSRAQADWLESALSALPRGRQVIVVSHCFFYASGYVSSGMPWYDHFGTIKEVAPILERHGVDLVVSGHNHYLELLRKNGVTYAVVGAMGGKPDPAPTYASPASLWIEQGTFGYLDLDIDESGIAMTFRDQGGRALREEFIPAAK